MVKVMRNGRLLMSKNDALDYAVRTRRVPDDVNQMIDGWLHFKNGIYRARIATRYSLMLTISNYFEMLTNLRISHKDVVGCIVYCDPYGQKFPRAYRWQPMTSCIYLSVRKDGKIEIDVRRRGSNDDTLIRFVGTMPENILKKIKSNYQY